MSVAGRITLSPGDTFCIHRELLGYRCARCEEAAPYRARISTLEARIAELTRELDCALASFDSGVEALCISTRETAAARVERDEAVGLLRNAVKCARDGWGHRNPEYAEDRMLDQADALLARLAAAPEKETTPPGPYSNT